MDLNIDPMDHEIFNIETLGEAMRPGKLDQELLNRADALDPRLHEAFRLSREERDHIAGHALDSTRRNCENLVGYLVHDPLERGYAEEASTNAREIAALSNLLGDIGWERTAGPMDHVREPSWTLGELFPIAQLRPWLEEWQRQDDEALAKAERALEVDSLEECSVGEAPLRLDIADAQTKLGTGAVLLARLEKWMASHGN